ncbi:MAG TPA: RDD family protein [Methylomirabilota bacterium]|nr:RDD family protein [Methylomirabilota bacterium]
MDEAAAMRPAGFWIRTAALVLDVMLFILVHASLSRLGRLLWGPADGGDGGVLLFTLLFAIAYTTTLHAVAGQTIGKSLVGVRVVAAADGARLTVGPALLRHLAYMLSLLPLGFGFWMAGLRRDKRALHDLIAGSRVEWAVPRRPVVRRTIPSRQPGPRLQDAAVAPAQAPVPDPGPEPRPGPDA